MTPRGRCRNLDIGLLACALAAAASTITMGTTTSPTMATTAASFLRQRTVGVNIEGAAKFASAPDALWANLSAAFSAVRFDVTWQRVEFAKPGVYNWTLYDALVSRCKAHGVLPYMILDYDNPPLYGACPDGQCLCQPRAARAFLNYSLAVVRRYAGAAVFELWNEPNNERPRPHNMPAARYASLLETLGRELRGSGIKEVAGAVLVAGATAGVDASYISEVGVAALSFADAVSVHPYTGSCGGPEIFTDKRAWQSGLFARLRQTLAPLGLPVLSSEVGWSTCSSARNRSASAMCQGYPGSEDTLQDQAIYLARQFLLNALVGIPATFVYQWADGDLNPANNSDSRPGEVHNASDGGDNFGLNFAFGGPPKPALLAATHFQRAVGRRAMTGRVVPVHPQTSSRGGGGDSSQDDSDFTYVLAFAPRPHEHEPWAGGTLGALGGGVIRGRAGAAAMSAPAAAAAAGSSPDLYAVWSLGMDKASAELVGVGNKTACAGLLAQVMVRSGALGQAGRACEAECQSAPRCRSFAIWPNATTTAAAAPGTHAASSTRWACSLYGSRCSPPAVEAARCGGSNAPPCTLVQAFTLRQTFAQNITFAAGHGACFAKTDVFGAAHGEVCADTATGLLSVGATEAPMYLIKENS